MPDSMTPPPEIADARALVAKFLVFVGNYSGALGRNVGGEYLMDFSIYLTRSLDQHEADAATIEARDETIKGLRAEVKELRAPLTPADSLTLECEVCGADLSHDCVPEESP